MPTYLLPPLTAALCPQGKLFDDDGDVHALGNPAVHPASPPTPPPLCCLQDELFDDDDDDDDDEGLLDELEQDMKSKATL